MEASYSERGTPASDTSVEATRDHHVKPIEMLQPVARDVTGTGIPPDLDFDDESAPLDLTGWEAEDELTAPDENPVVRLAAVEAQNALSQHKPVDISTDWDDCEAFLPEQASPSLGADSSEFREQLRLLLLRAVREGSIPFAAIEDLSRNEDGSPDDEAESLFTRVINDLGAEVDERSEYVTLYENFEVHVAPDAIPDEEDVVDTALSYIDSSESHWNDPLYLHQRVFQQEVLLSAEEEVAIGQSMEKSIEMALDALASAHSGIQAVLDAALLVKAGSRSLRWLTSGPHEELQDIEHGQLVVQPVSLDEPDNGVEIENNNGFSEFMSKVDHLRTIFEAGHAHSWPDDILRQAIGTLGLTGSFLMDLSDSARVIEHDHAMRLSRAMHSYKKARERMIVTNLKLVRSIALNYLYSNIPLNDLLQEGAIGLIKAVERFEWRRGFRFSTYATWWIRQQIGRYVADSSKTIRVPMHVYREILRITQVADAFELKKGRDPMINELAALMNVTSEKLAAYMQAAVEPIPIHEVTNLDDLVAIDRQDEFVARDPMEIVSDCQLVDSVDHILATVGSKEEQVLRMRFGIGVPDAMTLDEVGIKFDVTRERVRQIEKDAINYLKHPTRLEWILQNPRGFASPSPRPDICKKAVPQYTLDRLLYEATRAGAVVEDDRDGESKRVWVNFTSRMSDVGCRTLQRKLCAMDFKFLPGKGYWR